MIPPDTSSTKETEMSTTGGQSEDTAAAKQPEDAEAAPDLSALGVREGAGHSVKVDDLHAYYGQHHSIKGITLNCPANEVTALIGPSGSGKSTVVRCINRMHEEIPGARAEGSVTLDDLDVYGPNVDVTAVRRLIGMVFQKPNPFPTMSIFDNVAAGLRLTGTKSSDLKQLVEHSLQAVGLWDEVKDRLKTSALAMSGGQQQRLCIARALAVEPNVILLDEPASALDPISTQSIEDLMHDLKRDYTLVIVTHNMQQAARTADMTAFFSLDVSDGKRTGVLVEYADTPTIFTHPTDKRTEDYVTGRFG